VYKMYGHVDGAAALFELFMQQREDSSRVQFEKFVSTHPLDQERINRITRLAAENGWLTVGDVTSLPDDYKNWLSR